MKTKLLMGIGTLLLASSSMFAGWGVSVGVGGGYYGPRAGVVVASRPYYHYHPYGYYYAPYAVAPAPYAYVAPPATIWIAPHWEYRPYGRVWVRGYWRHR